LWTGVVYIPLSFAATALQHTTMDFECDIQLHVIKDQAFHVGLVEYMDKKRKYEVFVRQCESDLEDIVLKQKTTTKTMEIYSYLQNTDILSKDAQTLQLILTGFGKVGPHIQSVLISIFRSAKKQVIGLIENYDTPWFHKTYMEPTLEHDAIATKQIWQTHIDREISRIIGNTKRIVIEVKEKAPQQNEFCDFILDPLNKEFFTNKTRSIAKELKNVVSKKMKL